MKSVPQPALASFKRNTIVASIFLGLMLASGPVLSVFGQGIGQMASGTVSGTGGGPYIYSLTFSDATGATAPIGSIWYAWVPGAFYLPGTPTAASAPTGWTATISGDSVQYVANSAAFDIQPGESLPGFTYTAAFSPAQLMAAPNSGRSDAYSGGLFSDSGQIFNVVQVPEPSAGLLLVSGAVLSWVTGRRKLRAA